MKESFTDRMIGLLLFLIITSGLVGLVFKPALVLFSVIILGIVGLIAVVATLTICGLIVILLLWLIPAIAIERIIYKDTKIFNLLDGVQLIPIFNWIILITILLDEY